ncbi:flavin-containing monooxygenase [Hyalangium rubrum]|uniref:NAD(P)-binding domain-containing protein n=1 Tax=Hyalangium rubrum TaxID=3103134 RepID=A0ABU5HC36_9BACT|nr:FAD-dependent oxidoreductase [Hyalangium sp. s54d21]MDY7230398.1 NAD(P)-binding domain-containing protein [Hyalangium sp. s54d21]
MSPKPESNKRVAIVGAGPAGLVAARYLAAHGFEPVLFEQSADMGGQWNAEGTHSGVWPSMRTNSTRVTTCFSDLPHAEGVAMFPRNQEMLAYLRRYAEKFGLLRYVRLRTPIERLERSPESGRYLVSSKPEGGASRQEPFDHVVIASGRFHKPFIPAIPGLESFSGAGGVTHSFRYKEPEKYRGLRVLVAGCSISALEIASDLAMLGTQRVLSSMRRQRYIMQKISGGVPNEHLAFTRWGALAGEVFPLERIAIGIKEFLIRKSGSPEQYGAFKPSDNLFEAGITLSQHYLPLIAEGRITQKPWITEVRGQRVSFADGTSEEVDALILGTGYDLHLPFLSEELRQTLNVDTRHIDLHRFTFHPELEGLAFVGIFEVGGPFFPLLELQARWIAYTWANVRPKPSMDEMKEGVARYQARRGQPQEQSMEAMALMLSRLVGVEPLPEQYPPLTRALMFGPLSPPSFRLTGPDALPEAAERYAADAAAFGAFTSPELTDEERLRLERLMRALDDKARSVDAHKSSGTHPAALYAPASEDT